MNILIVEDEDLAVKKLLKTLSEVDDTCTVVGISDSIESTVQWLEQNTEPDLILMDIELADGESFEIFKMVDLKAPVIFTTSYDEYVLKAFKVNSIDYLLKPVQKEELSSALAKFRSVKKAYEGEARLPGNMQVENLIRELQQKLQLKDYRKRFLVKHAQKLMSIDVEDISYFNSDGRLNFFRTKDNKKFVVDYTMGELEDMLDPNKFFRISRSFFVSIECVDKIDDYFGHRLILGLKPSHDKEVTVSREKVTLFKKWMGK